MDQLVDYKMKQNIINNQYYNPKFFLNRNLLNGCVTIVCDEIT